MTARSAATIASLVVLAAEQKDAALRTFEFIVAENPASANAYDSLGEAYMTTGDPKKATAAYKKSLELDPKNLMIRQNYDLFKEINDRTKRRNGK